jgi:predicted DNA-binding transcriptional regulator YafY
VKARHTERNRQVIRQWDVLLALQEAPRTVGELAASLGVTVRTVYRDLDALQAARFALYTDNTEDGAVRWRLMGRNRAPARRAA